MCGRFALVTEKRILELLFRLEIRGAFEPRRNIAPSQEILAVRLNPSGGVKEPARLKWGLVPRWARDLSIGSRLINARSETAAEKPAFRDAFRSRRALIPASGFYEWKKEGKTKQPYHIGMKEGRLFSLAGLWEEHREAGGAVLESCAILTTAANGLVAPIHNRMPLIIPVEAYELWLDPRSPRAALRELLQPFPAELMSASPVEL